MLRSGKARAAASVGSTPRTSLRSGHGSVGESDIVICSQRVQEMIQRLERVLLAFDMVKNRSEKDSKRAELLSSVVDRLRILGTDITRIAQECGYEKDALSSEDTLNVDDVDVLMREPLNLNKEALLFYQEGVKAATADEVKCRKCRCFFLRFFFTEIFLSTPNR
ncbi:unnamed protein product [Gongylonema pulchrum]|uniref:Mediator complex subunit 30 n=1 Tax=Gongylonema pulchrum TaxID=637853 RepID=A0A183ERU4_9BILA|nr:unnamed protein product [Gongylonema pulchrum]